MQSRARAARLLAVLSVTALLGACGKSGYVHCVLVEDESRFTGEWLKAETPVSDSVVKLEACAALDAAEDNNSGAKAGTVRWAECFSGPDCDEAGAF